MPRAKCGKSTERTVDFYLTECREFRESGKVVWDTIDSRRTRLGLAV